MENRSGNSYRVCPFCNRMVKVNEKHNCRQRREHYRRLHENYAKRKRAVDLPLHTKRWHYLRRRIISADGGYCQRCWIKYHIKTYQHLEVHHIRPRIEYPQYMFDPNNLVTVCHTCNCQLGLSGVDFPWSPKDRKYKHIHYGYFI